VTVAKSESRGRAEYLAGGGLESVRPLSRWPQPSQAHWQTRLERPPTPGDRKFNATRLSPSRTVTRVGVAANRPWPGEAAAAARPPATEHHDSCSDHVVPPPGCQPVCPARAQDPARSGPLLT
jgi:hypothetical protein